MNIIEKTVVFPINYSGLGNIPGNFPGELHVIKFSGICTSLVAIVAFDTLGTF